MDRAGTPALPNHDREVAWKVNGERIVLAGWGTAIMMQFAHPLVAAGVAEHSTLGSNTRAWLDRMNRTLGAMLALTYGSPDEVAATAAHIDAIHGRVHGILSERSGGFAAGTPYSARDPDLLLWVLSTLMYSQARAYELLVGPLSPEEKDRGCLESHPVGVLLGIPAERLPTSMAAVDAYIDAMIADGPIAVGATARRLVQELFRPPWPRLLYPAIPVLRLPMVALLPPPLREAYGFRWGARREAAVRLMSAGSRAVLPLVPARLRYWPQALRAQARYRADLSAAATRFPVP